MDAKKTIEVKKILAPLAKKALGIYLYGSCAEGTEHTRSDIDICVVAGEKVRELYSETNAIMGKRLNLDIKLFEELPLHIKRSVVESGKLLFSKDEPALGEYLLFYRRLWNEQAAVRLGYEKAIG